MYLWGQLRLRLLRQRVRVRTVLFSVQGGHSERFQLLLCWRRYVTITFIYLCSPLSSIIISYNQLVTVEPSASVERAATASPLAASELSQTKQRIIIIHLFSHICFLNFFSMIKVTCANVINFFLTKIHVETIVLAIQRSYKTQEQNKNSYFQFLSQMVQHMLCLPQGLCSIPSGRQFTKNFTCT